MFGNVDGDVEQVLDSALGSSKGCVQVENI
jgi:hypothetical protein